MKMEFEISTVEELIHFLETENLNSNEICKILNKALLVFPDSSKPKNEIIQDFEQYWNKYEGVKERPLFI